jgi:hypothetical protein
MPVFHVFLAPIALLYSIAVFILCIWLIRRGIRSSFVYLFASGGICDFISQLLSYFVHAMHSDAGILLVFYFIPFLRALSLIFFFVGFVRLAAFLLRGRTLTAEPTLSPKQYSY